MNKDGPIGRLPGPWASIAIRSGDTFVQPSQVQNRPPTRPPGPTVRPSLRAVPFPASKATASHSGRSSRPSWSRASRPSGFIRTFWRIMVFPALTTASNVLSGDCGKYPSFPSAEWSAHRQLSDRLILEKVLLSSSPTAGIAAAKS